MNDLITLQDRNIQTPTGDDVDYGEEFDGDNRVWSLLETVTGETAFDSTNTEQIITHHFYIRFIEGITAETWIDFNGEKIDIVDVENLEERDEFLLLLANNRGDNTKQANFS